VGKTLNIKAAILFLWY